MSFYPNQITKEHIMDALRRIDSEDLALEPSRKFDVIINGNHYPPKEIMRYAHEEMNCEFIWERSEGEPTNKYLTALGFAIVNKSQESHIPELDSVKLRNVWLYAPGENASLWIDNQRRGEMTIGWDNIGDLRNYQIKEDIQKNLQNKNPEGTDQFFASRMLWSFVKVVYPGDIIIVKTGQNTILGKGLVVSEYIWDNKREEFKNIRKVKWEITGSWLLDDLNLPQKTLTLLSDKPYLSKLLACFITNKPLNTMQKNQILYGPPGTGKTYNTINKAIGIVNPNFDLSEERSKVKDEYDRLVNEGQIVFTTFHQSMSYEDFIEGIKPISKEGQVTYDVLPGVFKKLCLTAEEEQLSMDGKGRFELAFEKLQQEWELNTEMKFPLKTEGYEYTIKEFTHTSIRFRKASGGEGHTLSITTLRDYYYQKRIPKNTGVGIYYPAILNKLLEYESDHIDKKDEIKNFVLIIDEINRGNVSQIFGELITLLEEDKRLGAAEALEATLPYSQEKFSVPSNLYIIGTMNTADRSVEALDTALRRRFSFHEMPPKPELIASEGKLKDQNGILVGIDLPKLLETINVRIERLVDKDHKIGHSYFMSVSSLKDLKLAFQNKIIPLLQEYFFGDYGKIGLVLGEAFFNNKGKQESSSNIFASFNGYDSSVFMERPVYNIRNINEMSNPEFIKAITTLNPNLIASLKKEEELEEHV